MKINDIPFEDYVKLSKEISKYFSGKGIKPKPIPMNSELKRIVDEYFSEKGEGKFSRAELNFNAKDPYRLLYPKQMENNKKVTISKTKFLFLWEYLELDSVINKVMEDIPDNFLHDMFKKEIYKNDDINGDLSEGSYLLKRPSLNTFIKGSISVIRLWIYTEKNLRGQDVLKYKSRNMYEQGVSEQGVKMVRERVSEGFVLRNQYNTLLFGRVSYTHLNEVDGISATNNYPEIISIHTASPDSNLFLGFTLANYPDLKKPAVTQCTLEKLAVKGSPNDFDKEMETISNDDERLKARGPTDIERSLLNIKDTNSEHPGILIPTTAPLFK